MSLPRRPFVAPSSLAAGAAGVLALGLLTGPAAVAEPSTPVTTIGVGGRPSGAAISPDGSTAYISNPGTGTIDIIDLEAGQLVQSIDVAAGVQPPVLNLAGTRLYATTQADANLLIIDTAAGSVLSQVKVGTQPTAPVLSRNGKSLFIANTGSGDVSIIDVASGTVTRTIPVGSRPLSPTQGTGSQYAPLDGLLFVTNAGDETLSTIDLSTGQQVAEDGLGGSPTRAAVSPFLGVINDMVYVSDTSDGTVTILDQERGGSAATVRVGSRPSTPVASVDGTALFVANNGSDSVSVIDTERSPTRITTTIPVGDGPTTPLLSPNGRILFVPATSGSSITAIDTSTLRVRGTYLTGRNPVSPALSPDAKTLVVPNSGNGTVSIINLTVQALPFPPRTVTITPKIGRATASWSLSNEAGVTGYVVTALPGGQTCTSTGSRCTVTGLVKGKGYRFSVQAANGFGTGAATVSNLIRIKR